MVVIESKDLDTLISALAKRGYDVIGPRIRDSAIVLDTVSGSEDLPKGWTAVQEPGSFRLEKREAGAYFGFTVGPHSWKKFLFPPRLRLFSASRAGKGFEVNVDGNGSSHKYAFFGVRSCEIQALGLLDKVFKDGPYADHGYSALRPRTLIVAVNCVEPAGTCFCASMNTGPEARSGYDIVMTEILGPDRHVFMAEAGTDAGREILAEVPQRQAEAVDAEAVQKAMSEASARMGRQMVSGNLRPMANEQFDHPRWDELAKRCLGCTNCTMVCPTCFCTTVEDVTDLTGATAERWRRWDSCFTGDFTKVAGGNIRMSTKSRYRQWITHKLVNWVDQFGSPGCVGCGRCITWCPVGIDITQEAAAFVNAQNVKPTT